MRGAQASLVKLRTCLLFWLTRLRIVEVTALFCELMYRFCWGCDSLCGTCECRASVLFIGRFEDFFFLFFLGSCRACLFMLHLRGRSEATGEFTPSSPVAVDGTFSLVSWSVPCLVHPC